jgi:hypothetical protein
MISRRFSLFLLFAVLLLGATLRVAAARGEFWLDEAWSALIARGAENPYVDNNHLLNTAFMRLVGPVWHWQIYRIPSVILGVATVYLAWRIVSRRVAISQTFPALVAAFVVAVSYPLVIYSSEARGYAPAIFFSLLCFDVLCDAHQVNRKWPIGYWICCILGMLCHLTFLQFLGAAIVYTYFVSKRNLGEALRLHGIPVAGAVVFYFLFVRYMHIAGGPASSPIQVILATAALFTGGSTTYAAILFLLLLALLLVRLFRRRDPLFSFAVALIIAPFALLAVKTLLMGHAEILYVRYFLVPATFVLFLGAAELARMTIESRRAFVLTALLLICFTLANGWQITQFLRFGRGEPLSAFRYIIGDRTDNAVYLATLWPDEPDQHDFRASRLLEFYAAYLPDRPKLVLLKSTSAAAAEWLLVSSASGSATPVIQFKDQTYILQKVFPHYGLSGWTWCAYRRADMVR